MAMLNLDMQLGLFLGTIGILVLLQFMTCLTWGPEQPARERVEKE